MAARKVLRAHHVLSGSHCVHLVPMLHLRQYEGQWEPSGVPHILLLVLTDQAYLDRAAGKPAWRIRSRCRRRTLPTTVCWRTGEPCPGTLQAPLRHLA